VIESVSGPSGNQIEASISYTLPNNVDTLTLIGTGDQTALGNGNADSITANSGNEPWSPAPALRP
jgi:hypothetical protein